MYKHHVLGFSIAGRAFNALTAGNALELIRQDEGYSSEQFAEMLGITVRNLERIEDGEETLTPDLYVKIERLLPMTWEEKRDLYLAAALEYLDGNGWSAQSFLVEDQLFPETQWPRRRAVRGPTSLDYRYGTFERQLQRYRKARRLTKEDLAASVGVTANWIASIENARAPPSQDLTYRLADALDLDREAFYRLLVQSKRGALQVGPEPE